MSQPANVVAYDLFAVVNQENDQLDAFASALCNNKNDKYWYLFKDRSVRRSYDLAKLATKRTTLLFYRRTLSAPAAWKTLKQLAAESVASMLAPDNAVVLFQHAAVAHADHLQMRCVQIIIRNLDAATSALPPDALQPAEAALLLDLLRRANLVDRRVGPDRDREKAEEGRCTACERERPKLLRACPVCRRTFCRRCRPNELDSHCTACTRLQCFL